MKPSTEIDYRARILRAQAYLETHLDEAIAPADLAGVACFSLHHFHRIFRGVTGESVAEHQRRLRLERAARRLRDTDRPIFDLALDAGYDSHEAFTRAFRARFEMAPSEFRETPSARVEAFVRAHPDGEAPNVELRTIASIRVAYLRHVGSWTGVSALFDQLFQWAGSRGLIGPGIRVLGRCPDDPEITPEDKLRFDACIAVDGEFSADETCRTSEIPGGTYAIAHHRGPYRTLTNTYLALIGRWLPGTHYALADEPVVEAYLDDDRTTPEDELRTEVWARLLIEP
jgi:AraC family transcriptional regulator